MLQPKRTKFRKMCRGRRKGKATTGNSVDFGEFGLKALACNWITARQIVSARVAITRHLQRGGQVWIRVFPDNPEYLAEPFVGVVEWNYAPELEMYRYDCDAETSRRFRLD